MGKENNLTEKIIVYEDDVTICYLCGCKESKLEPPYYPSDFRYCDTHKTKVETPV